MKNRIILLSFSALLLFAVGCDKGFDEMNVNRTAATNINPVFILNNAVLNCNFANGTVIYELGIVQQMISPNEGVLAGANFNQDNRGATLENWQKYYRTVSRHSQDVINQVKNNPARSNLYNMARIIQAYAFMVLTDSYGDIPYKSAGKGFSDQITLPEYDSQQSIYTDLIKELTESFTALDAAKTRETADVLFGGDVNLWKKFANSLILRAGMRLSKVDANQAKSIVSAAAGRPLIETNNDNVMIKHDANYINGIGNWLNATEAANLYMAAPFVTYLKSNNDPRLRAIAVRYVGANSGPQQVQTRANSDTAVQIGMPLGFNNSTIATQVTANGLASFYEFTQVDRNRIARNTTPTFLVTASQTQLLLAEAANRGWVSGNAKDFYENGIRLHMQQMEQINTTMAIPAADINAYIQNNPYQVQKGLELINTQYWVSSFLNGPEAFANFRRSGFPTLTPNPFPGKSIKGTFIRRLTYPNSEISVNNTNVKAALSRMGEDDLDTRVWWDKQ